MVEALPSDLARVDPVAAWSPWVPSAATPWDRRWVAHLYRRAAFGPSPADTDRALADGFTKTLARILAGDPDAADRLALLTDAGRYYSDPVQLRVWWLYTMLEGGHPLREKLTLFWHDHFATSYAKTRSTRLMFEQNVTLRRHALASFRPLLVDLSRDPAMLVWLDSNRNVKGAPNENYAREVMELFALGVGNYTERDVREAARAFTGWHHDPEVTAFEFNDDLHDGGEKTLLGGTGKFGGEEVLNLCLGQPACATFLVGKLYAFLVSETPPPKGLLDPLVARFRKSNYDIADLATTVLGSRLFFSDHAYRKRVKWPVEYALGAVRAVVPGRVPLADLTAPLAKMGQVLFQPPNVKGWRTGTDWLNSATLLARNNFAETVATGNWPRTSARSPSEREFFGTTKPAVAAAEPAGEVAVPVPDAPFDPAAVVLTAKPSSAAAAVSRMGELLFGEPVPRVARAKVERFLLDGKAALGEKGVDDPAFRVKVREALHALMCLPEYQLG